MQGMHTGPLVLRMMYHHSSFFHLGYFQQQSQMTTIDSLLQTEYITQGDHPVSPLARPQRDQQPTAPFNNVWSSSICNDRLVPKDYNTGCSIQKGSICVHHSQMSCSTCLKKFHKGCILSLQYIPVAESENLTCLKCMECTCREQSRTDDDLPFDQLNSVQEKLARFGLEYCPNDADANLKMMRTTLKGMKKDLEKCLSCDQVTAVIGSKPRPFPTPLKMNPEAMDKHVRCLELSMLV